MSKIIYLGADHAGFVLKEKIKHYLARKKVSFHDCGDLVFNKDDDYPDFAAKVAKNVSEEYETAMGILICGSGVGVDVVANKFPRVRSALAMTPDQAFDARNDENANILSLASNYTSPEEAEKIVSAWLATPFAGDERYRRRLKKIEDIELETR